MKKSILYGCSYIADLERDNITYVDIIPGLKKSHNCIYLCEDIRNINFNDYDIILCSPPCNYYSRANYRRNISEYSLKTKELLPYCINNAYRSGKPFLIENVRNKTFMFDLPIPKDLFIYEFGRHTYFTNIMIDFTGLQQRQDFKNGGYVIKYEDIQNKASKNKQGGYNVKIVFNYFLDYVIALLNT